MVEALVEYDYIAQEPDELSIKKGDIIREVVKKKGGWWEGTLNDKKGMFPDNFVRLVEKDSVTYRNQKDVSRIRQCRVIFSYKQDHEDELNLNIGETIDILGEEEEGWWRGLANGKEGVFPSNFVEEIKSSRSKAGSKEDLMGDENEKIPVLPPKPAKILCQAKFPYKAQNEDELNLKEGDIITVLSKEGLDPGWWKGELNGQVGVFPDNFVSLVQNIEDKPQHKEEKRPIKLPSEMTGIKPSNIASQRKSEEVKHENEAAPRITPPLPGKKPSVPVKKSPSGSGAAGGLFSGLRKKLVDAVDGSTGSKNQPVVLTKATEIKTDIKPEPENAFDQVERTSMLSDVRATRAKAPGRRPPSIVFKEGEIGIVNGNADHTNLDALSEFSNLSSEQDESEVKPRVREWQKHKAPWLAEMKLNQAKRTSTSPGPEQNKLKLTPSDKNTSPDIDETKSNKTSPFEKELSSPIESSKPLFPSSKLKTPPNELEKSPSGILRQKPPQLTPTARPQTIANIPNCDAQKLHVAHHSTSTKISPITVQNKSPLSGLKPLALEKQIESKGSGDCTSETGPSNLYAELLERLEKLESIVEKQNHEHKLAIEELKGKLQVETDMRMLLQAELDKLSQCVLQV